MANVTISRKPEKNKHCIVKKEGKRKKYYCVEQKELKDYLYDIMYMQDQNINLAVRIIPEKKKFYEYSIFPDRIQITEKEILSDQDPESYVSAEYLGEPLVIIKEPISKLKKQYGPPWYQDPKVVSLISAWVIIILGFGVYFIKSHNKKIAITPISNKHPSPPKIGKTLAPQQKETLEEDITKDALYNIAYAIEQTTSVGLPAYISDISYTLQDNPPAQGKDETIAGNLSITFRFAYPAKGSILITTKPIPVYSKTVNINLKSIDTKLLDNLDNKTCGMDFLKYGLNLYNVDNEEFKGTIKDYNTFYAFIKTAYYCKDYIKSLKLANLEDIVSGKTNSENNISADIDLFLLK